MHCESVIVTVNGVPAFQLAPMERDDDMINRLLTGEPKVQATPGAALEQAYNLDGRSEKALVIELPRMDTSRYRTTILRQSEPTRHIERTGAHDATGDGVPLASQPFCKNLESRERLIPISPCQKPSTEAKDAGSRFLP